MNYYIPDNAAAEYKKSRKRDIILVSFFLIISIAVIIFLGYAFWELACLLLKIL